jgi:phosphoribosylanthranilate isomerase
MTKIKICGITNVQDAQLAIEAGADLLGFVFYPKSPRFVKPGRVREIVTQLRAQISAANIHMVGVFVDETPAYVAKTLDSCALDFAQLHGAEPPEMVAHLMERAPGVVKAFRVRNEASLAEMERFQATAYLLDAFVPGQPGGTGHRFDWSLAAQAKAHGPIILAGGLTPDNVAQAIRAARPWGVDVSSGVEALPGRKDPTKVRRFIAAAKNTRTEETYGNTD